MSDPHQPEHSTADSSATVRQMSWRPSGVDSDHKREALRAVLQQPLEGRHQIESVIFSLIRKAVFVLTLFVACGILSAMEVENSYVVASFVIGAVVILCWPSNPTGS